MKSYTYIFILVMLLGVNTLLGNEKVERRAKLEIVTNKGNVVIVLYNETPLHRDNFMKLAKSNFFDNTLFHRVINDFMIQGGDPDSKNAKKGKALGSGGLGYRIDAEFVPNLIHKKGALAAARNGDRSNPKRKSSSSQFYLVKGQVFTHEKLDNMELKENRKLRQELINSAKKQHKATIDSLVSLYKTKADTLALSHFLKEQNKIIDSIVLKKGFHFTPLQRKYYTTIGGVPYLDDKYTVFGEMVEGFSVLDSISSVPTDGRDRPIEDIIVKKIKVLKDYKK